MTVLPYHCRRACIDSPGSIAFAMTTPAIDKLDIEGTDAFQQPTYVTPCSR